MSSAFCSEIIPTLSSLETLGSGTLQHCWMNQTLGLSLGLGLSKKKNLIERENVLDSQLVGPCSAQLSWHELSRFAAQMVVRFGR